VVVLSKREKIIVWVTAVVVGVLALDWLVVGPLLTARSEASVRVSEKQDELDRAQRTFENARRVNRRWAEMVRGQLQQDASSAESAVLNGVRDWAQASRLTLTSLKPERTEKQKDFTRITFRATGFGTMEEVAGFLFQAQTAPIAVRVTDVQISSRKEGLDDLSINVGVATIHLNDDPSKPAVAPEARQ